jgi:hypothetical protein
LPVVTHACLRMPQNQCCVAFFRMGVLFIFLNRIYSIAYFIL